MAEDSKVYTLEVQTEKREGKNSSYDVTFVKSNDEIWVISKRDLDKVEAGKSYEFTLSKSDYKGKTYNWANLVEKKEDQPAKITSDDVKGYFKDLEKSKQINMLKWMLDNLKD